ncbi:hypothetical protein LSAT2_009820 [Lamellibrachia satsuma]|nr:hypothetical protein LSAT2_009820 [Lamellibrachia satsuma]
MKVSSYSQSPIGPPTRGLVASVSLVNQSSNGYQVLQGLTSLISEDRPVEINLQEGCLPFDKMCHQNDRRPTDYCEPDVQLKADEVDSDECNSNSGDTRKWVVYEGGLVKEILKVESTHWSVGTSIDSSKNIDQKEERCDESVSEKDRRKKLDAYEMWVWRRMLRVSWVDKKTRLAGFGWCV